jgi:hypothetical protein
MRERLLGENMALLLPLGNVGNRFRGDWQPLSSSGLSCGGECGLAVELPLLDAASIRNTLTSSAPRAPHLLSARAAPSTADCMPTETRSTLLSRRLQVDSNQGDDQVR